VAARQTQIISAGDFRSHNSPVTCVAVDEILGSSTDVFASCDERGKVLVWTVSRVANNKSGNGTTRNIISRRPQRMFSCIPCPEACCDLSWQMGIVACATVGLVSIFSIERNERLHVLDIHRDIADSSESGVGRSYRLWRIQDAVKIRKLLLCDDGLIIMHVEVTENAQNDGDLLGLSQFSPQKSTAMTTRHFLAVYTLHGARVGLLQLHSPNTFLSCPGRNSVVISGHRDGSVLFLSAYTLQLLYEFRPHEKCLTCVVAGGGRGSVVVPEPENAAVLCVRLGPDLVNPTVVCVSTSSGALYVRALPDFIKWDKGRMQSTLAQIVNAPIQAVRGALQTTQHLSAVATDAAGVLASNAKSFADETFAKVCYYM
jgi:hypothetical protein